MNQPTMRDLYRDLRGRRLKASLVDANDPHKTFPPEGTGAGLTPGVWAHARA